MRYCGDVDGSCRPWTEVVFRRRKLHCGPWTEVVSYATPPHLVKVKISFDEAQKLTWKEIKCLYGLIKIITSNYIREAEIFTPRGPAAGSFQHTLWPSRGASEAAILVSCAFAFVLSWYKVIIPYHCACPRELLAKFPHSPILHYAYSLLLKENNSANNRLPLGLFALFSKSWIFSKSFFKPTKCRLRIYPVFSSDTW